MALSQFINQISIMKKSLLGIAILMAVSIGAKAQFSLGIKGGVNFSKINTDNLKESSTTGYQAGLFARFGSDFYVQPEVYVGSKGSKFDFDVNTSGTTVIEHGKETFTTLNVPLLLGKSFGENNLNFRIMAGPIYSYYMSRSDNFSTNINNSFQDFGRFKRSTLGYQAGAGVDIGPASVDLRYEGGLTKINDDYGQRPNLWALSLGFKIL